MSARLVTVFLPEGDVEAAYELSKRHAVRQWVQPAEGALASLVCVVQGRYVERLIGDLETHFSGRSGFTAIVSPVEAVVPALYENAGTALPPDATSRSPTRIEEFFSRDRLSTEELQNDIEESVRLKPSFLFAVLASALIAGLGMQAGQVAIVIGAMVIAPFLGPSIGLAMAATVGDLNLARRASLALAVGAILALVLMVSVGALFPFDLTSDELQSRTHITAADIVLALTSGAVGVLAFSRGASMSLVGVMIAVALVPPLSAAGLFLGSGHLELAPRALFLFATNLVCINVAGIAAFLVQGLPPKNWRITAGLLLTWCLLLALMLTALFAEFGFAVLW